MKKVFLLILFLISVSGFAQEKKICISFDDLVFSSRYFRDPDFQFDRSLNLLGTLMSYKVPAIGFVNESKLYNGNRIVTKKVNLLEMWLMNGFELGNHTYSHKDYNTTPLSDFIEDIIKGEKYIRPFCEKYNKPLKYFRHPYLHRGDSKEKVEELETYLKEAGYIEAPVTIDNAEWIFAAAYDSLLYAKETKTLEKIKSDYIKYMEAKLTYYESQSEKLFGRNINHILLLHANTLNCDTISDLLDMLRRHHYKFVSMEEALKDDVYKSEDAYYKKAGISWIHRWAFTKGVNKEFFGDEPECPAYVLNLAKVDYE